jgi:hypothetical protein
MMTRTCLHRTNGQSLVEFVFTIAIICLILYAIVDIVRMGIIQHVLDSACREGVRYAAHYEDLAYDETAVLARVTSVLQEGNLPSVPTPVIQFLDGDGALIENQQYAEYGNYVRITADVQYRHVFSLVTREPVTLSGSAVIKYLVDENT